MDSLLKALLSCRQLSTFQADAARRQYRDLLDDSSFVGDAKEFRLGVDHLDHFLLRRLTSKPDLKEVVKIILLFSHGNAEIERGFRTAS